MIEIFSEVLKNSVYSSEIINLAIHNLYEILPD